VDEYFVRVYTMKDGTKKEPNAVYAKYEQALVDLSAFNPSGADVEDMQNVSYVQVEKRFSPTSIWHDGDGGIDNGTRCASR